jgi:thymidylate synthase ThyX
MIEARIVADSVNPAGDRITSFVLTYPRFIHSELMTHRAFSRNAASSRAIPVSRMMRAVRETTARPEEWGTNQSGMQAGPPLTGDAADRAVAVWDSAMEQALLTFEGAIDAAKDFEMHDRLAEAGHWSPFEHCAQAMSDSRCWSANFRGWSQYRKQFAGENRCADLPALLTARPAKNQNRGSVPA